MSVVVVLLLAGCTQPVSDDAVSEADQFSDPGVVSGPYGVQGENTTIVSVLPSNLSEYPHPYWEVNETILERFPVMHSLLDLGGMLGYFEGRQEIGVGYFDRAGALDLCRFTTSEAWNYPDGDGGTQWSPGSWAHEDRLYRFRFQEWSQGCY